jgi:hypothetical protein
MEVAELPEQRALGLGLARVEFPHLDVEQVIEEERQRGRTFLSAIDESRRVGKPALLCSASSQGTKIQPMASA